MEVKEVETRGLRAVEEVAAVPNLVMGLIDLLGRVVAAKIHDLVPVGLLRGAESAYVRRDAARGP